MSTLHSGDPHAHGARLYRGYPARPPMSGARLHHGIAVALPEFVQGAMERLRQAFAQAFVGITADGTVQSDLHPLQSTGIATAPLVSAAKAYLASLRRFDHQRQAIEPLASPDRRRWTNAFPNWAPAGVFLADLSAAEREAALKVIEATLSARGFADARNIMRANQAFGEFLNHSRDTLNEFGFFFTIFGEPSTTGPWGWRIMGNHLVIHCTVVGDQVVLTPAFLGSEMSVVDEGPHAGLELFVAEQRLGLELASSLTPAQRKRAVLYPSMRKADLPPPLTGPDGRHLGGAGQDNRVIPYQGIESGELSPGQRELLLRLVDVYVGRQADGHAALQMETIRKSFAATRFAWIGDPEQIPFYYRIHGPAILIEFDHHSGIFLANDEPEPFHIHTIVRTPNGHDYGMDLLAQHYAQFPHDPAPR